MSVGVEVDALALMLDGASLQHNIRFERYNVQLLAGQVIGRRSNPPAMERYVTYPEWAEVAEAILELEAWADWKPSPDADPATDPIVTSALADAALDEADARNPLLGWFDEMHLEAAALLRDGWRPRKRSKR